MVYFGTILCTRELRTCWTCWKEASFANRCFFISDGVELHVIFHFDVVTVECSHVVETPDFVVFLEYVIDTHEIICGESRCRGWLIFDDCGLHFELQLAC